MAAKTDIIFCGNPGVGKSAIATTISGVQFVSGLSFGSGKTTELKWTDASKIQNVRFADTPGLDDVELREKAAAAITSALADGAATGHQTKVIFVITTEGGRLRPADMYTIRTVMQSIKLANGESPGANSYGVIINKCPFMNNASFLRDGKAKLDLMLSETKNNPIPTAHTKYIAHVPEIADAENAEIPVDGLLDWVLNTPSIQVVHAEEIDTRDQDEIIAALMKEHNEKVEHLEKLSEEQAKKLTEESTARRQLEEHFERKVADLKRQTEEREAAAKKEIQTAKAKLDQILVERQTEMQKMMAKHQTEMENQRADNAKNQAQATDQQALLVEQNAMMKKLLDSHEAEKRETQEKSKLAEEAASREANFRYYYWRQYGNNEICLYSCSKSVWEDNKKGYSLQGGDTGKVNTSYYYGGTSITKRFKHPQLVYCSDTWWYGYFRTNTSKIDSATGSFKVTDPMDLVV